MSEIKRTTMGGKPVFTVPAKTVINFDSGFKEKLLCDGPTFTAGTACQYSCEFCYVPDTFRKQKPWLEQHGVIGQHKDIVIRRENAVEIARRQLQSHSPAERAKHKVIYSSPAVDVASNMELVRETVEICKVILELTNWDIRLLSKSNLLPKVATLLDLWNHFGDCGLISKRDAKERIIYGVSTGTLDDRVAKAIETGTPLVSKRIESLHWLQDNGYRTFGMICPSLPQDSYGEFSESMAGAIRIDRCEEVWAEVINCRGDSFTRTFRALSDAGLNDEAKTFKDVSIDLSAWEKYARMTFISHLDAIGAKKLRFLQYVNNSNRHWWTPYANEGAVLL